MRIGVVAASVLFILLLACVGGAEFFFQRGSNSSAKNPAALKIAEQLNPFVSEYFYEDYRLTGDIKVLRQAVFFEPSKPAYHMYYGLALMKQTPRTRFSDQEAVAEICKAARLKPYSKLYQDTCEQFKKAIPVIG